METIESSYHKPVLVEEVVHYMAPKPSGTYIDATFGGGGHTRALLTQQPACKVIGVDWDKTAIEQNAPPIEQEFGQRFKAIWGSFSQLGLLLKRHQIGQVDGILADFGTSTYQIFQKPGFSFAHDTALDMRMSPAHQRYTAYHLVNKASEEELAYIIHEYGEEPQSRRLARALIEARRIRPIKTTGQLADIIASVIGRNPRSRIHPATRVFQAFRIAVNHELDNIRALLSQSLTVLAPQGRLVCISFHSLEDRLVKNFLRDHRHDFNLLTAKAVKATPEEIRYNPSARSARLRAGERKSHSGI